MLAPAKFLGFSLTSDAVMFDYASVAMVACIVVPTLILLSRRCCERYLCFHRRRPVKGGIPVAPQDAVAILGHAAHLSPDVISGTFKLCVEGADSDSGLCSFWLTTSPAVSVLKAEHAREVLTQSSHREKIGLIAVHMDAFLGKKALVTLQHEEWRIHRRLISSAFKYSHLKAMCKDISEVGTTLVQTLQQGRHGDNLRLDLVNVMKKATLDVIGLTSFNHRFECCESEHPPEMASAFKFLLAENSRRSFEAPLNPASWCYWLPTPANAKFHRCREMVHGLLRGLIHKHRSLLSAAARDKNKDSLHQNFMTLMLMARDGENSKVRLSDEALIDNLMVFFFGGFDTTSIGLAYAAFCLAKHPDIARRLRSEVENVMGERTQVTYEDYLKMKFTTACWKEVLRLYPPAPLTVRHLTDDLDLDGNTIPKGTMIYLPIWWIHRDSRNWNDPESFQPDRFMDEGERQDHHSFKNFFAFSGGSRNCVGKRFALLEGTILLSMLGRYFDFSIPEGAPKVEPTSLGVVQEAKNGIVLRLDTHKNILKATPN